MKKLKRVLPLLILLSMVCGAVFFVIYRAEHLAEHRKDQPVVSGKGVEVVQYANVTVVKYASVAAENAARDASDKAMRDGTLKPVVDSHPWLTELIREITPDPLLVGLGFIFVFGFTALVWQSHSHKKEE